MREILFRGKSMINRGWVYGSVILWDDGSCSIEQGNLEQPMVAVERNSIGQGTSLRDKNGGRIFEGDILSGYFSAGVCVNGLVEFNDGSFGISWKWGDGRQFAAFTSITHSVEFEIVGNCHDNPELLEVSHE